MLISLYQDYEKCIEENHYTPWHENCQQSFIFYFPPLFLLQNNTYDFYSVQSILVNFLWLTFVHNYAIVINYRRSSSVSIPILSASDRLTSIYKVYNFIFYKATFYETHSNPVKCFVPRWRKTIKGIK